MRDVIAGEREVITDDLHSMTKVEAVRVVALDTRVKLYDGTAGFARFDKNPLEQRPTIARRSGVGIGDQVVDFQHGTGTKHLGYAIPDHCTHHPLLVLCARQTKPVLRHAPHGREKRSGGQVGSQLPKDRPAALYVPIGNCRANLRHQSARVGSSSTVSAGA